MHLLFFDGWPGLYRLAAMGLLAYVTLIAFLRISGKRTLAKLNAFDFVVTIALGSTLSTAVLDQQVTLTQCALAFAVLIGLQYAVSWSTLRVRWLRRLLRSDPSLLLYDGRLIEPALQAQRVTEGDVRSAVRSAGVSDLRQVRAVVLESDGTLSVVRSGAAGMDSLQGVDDVR